MSLMSMKRYRKSWQVISRFKVHIGIRQAASQNVIGIMCFIASSSRQLTHGLNPDKLVYFPASLHEIPYSVVSSTYYKHSINRSVCGRVIAASIGIREDWVRVGIRKWRVSWSALDEDLREFRPYCSVASLAKASHRVKYSRSPNPRFKWKLHKRRSIKGKDTVSVIIMR